MDQARIGAFIQQMRKEIGMTQKELAEKLNMSDKTISKWETGKGLPDVSLLPSLCQILNININELLVGEKLPPDELSKKAEDNTLSLLRENYHSKRGNIFAIVIGICVLFIGVFMMFYWGSIPIIQYLDIPTFGICICLCTAIVLISGKRTKKEIIHLLKSIIIPLGSCVSLMASIYVMNSTKDFSTLSYQLAIATLSILYALVAYVVLIVIEQTIKK